MRRVSRATSSARAVTCAASQSSSTSPTRSAVAGSIKRTAREQLRGVAADQAPERAVDHAARKQPHLHFVESEPEIALRHDAVVAVDGEHRAAGRTVAGEREHDRHRARWRSRAARATGRRTTRSTASRSSSSMPGTSRPAENNAGLPGDHDRRVGFAAPIDRGDELAQQLAVERVHRRPRELSSRMRPDR